MTSHPLFQQTVFYTGAVYSRIVPLTDEDRLRLENRELIALLNEYAMLRSEVREDTVEHLSYLIRKTRNRLQAIAGRRKPLPVDDRLEIVCAEVVRYATLVRFGKALTGERPILVVCLDRLSSRRWEAYIDEYEDLGIGKGRSGLEAAQRLFSTVKQQWQLQTRKRT